MIRTRFAPSPTGDLHLGGAWTALASWVIAKREGGRVVLRMEDLDPPRVVRGAAERLMEDVAFLGLSWDEGPDVLGPHAPYTQSARTHRYEAALEKLGALGLTYPCDCSRAEIARVASAPHAGEEVIYPGICRERDPARAMKRAPSIRLRVPEEIEAIHDQVMGSFAQRLDQEVGDFVLRRGDDVFAYQLAVAVDDLEMEITDVVRGRDLLASTPRQLLLRRLLAGDPSLSPRYWHLPLVVAHDGTRLAKRSPGAEVRALRARGISAESIVGELAFGLGLAETNAAVSATELARATQGAPLRLRTESFPIPTRFAG